MRVVSAGGGAPIQTTGRPRQQSPGVHLVCGECDTRMEAEEDMDGPGG